MFSPNRNTPALTLEGPLFGAAPSPREGRASTTRLLLPIDATDKSKLSLAYVKMRHQRGEPLEVCLLNVGEPVKDLEVLRFRTRKEMAEFQQERAQFILAEAAETLASLGIAQQAYFCVGEIPEAIQFAASHLQCDAIVLPEPHPAWQHFFRRDNVRALIARHKHVPVIMVDDTGAMVETARAA